MAQISVYVECPRRTELCRNWISRFSIQHILDFVDESDPAALLVEEVNSKCEQQHWKGATRKLKRLSRQYPNEVPEELFVKVLQTCANNRLQGARASEPARKIMEQLAERHLEIPSKLANYCVRNCLGYDKNAHSTHQGFGGVDTALAMMSAMKQAQSEIASDTLERVASALAKEGSLDEALSLLQGLVVERTETPSLALFAKIAEYAVKHVEDEHAITLLSYAKAAGYQLDTIGSSEYGKAFLANVVVAAERLEQDALVFRLLNSNDDELASFSNAAQRACLLVHKRAINKAVAQGEWKLGVKVLELMIQRNLRASPWIWRNVVACCAKAKKSKKATGLLLDWVKLASRGDADTPPLSAFNTCINACEICNEQELTLKVLDVMKETHDTDGNLITFNIALKRLAKQGSVQACEGIIIGMLQGGVEPSVVSYTTAIAACASAEPKQSKDAYEWLNRMRSRRVTPNLITYNTALSACADGTLEGSFLGSKIASEMLDDVDERLAKEDEAEVKQDVFREIMPDWYTKQVARTLMQQLKQNWVDGLIEKKVATETVRVPLLRLVDFQKSEEARIVQERLAARATEVEAESAQQVEIEVESLSHRIAEV